MGGIAAQFWLEITKRNIAVTIERVASKDNVADGPSRDRYNLVHRLGWRRVEVTDTIDYLEEALLALPELQFPGGPVSQATHTP